MCTEKIKYSSEYHDDEIRSFIAEGHTLSAYAGFSGISKKTLYSWLNKHRSFAKSYEDGYNKGLLALEDLAIDQLRNSSRSFDSKLYAEMKTAFKADKHAIELSNADVYGKMNELIVMLSTGAITSTVATAVMNICDRIHGYIEYDKAKEELERLKDKL